MRAFVAVVAVAALLAACRAPTPQNPGAGARSTVDPSGSATGSPTFSPGAVAATLTGTPEAPVDATPTSSARPFVTIGSVDDRRGDAGAEARAYNDLIGVRIQDDGVRARILVRLGETIPKKMPDGEQMGIGVDLYHRAGDEDSAYQLFAAGTSEGWLAFFETPNGFVDYETKGGVFSIGADIMEFVIPWSAMSDLERGHFATFLDWDREALAVGIAGQDRAPNGETRARFAR